MANRNLCERLSEQEILLADGATGTMLEQLGLRGARCAEEWNLSRPDMVGLIPHKYAEAGSDIVYTNTFGGNRLRLEHAGLADKVYEVNAVGARIARDAVGEEVIVAGSMGPTGGFMEPLGSLTPELVCDVYAEQAEALVKNGVDALVLETFSALDEIEAAIQGVRSVANVPLITTMSFDTGGRTMMGVTPEDALHALLDAGSDVVGFNCGSDLETAMHVAEAMSKVAPPDAVLIAKPNAGKPRIRGEQVVWETTIDEMVQSAKRFVALGHHQLQGEFTCLRKCHF